MNLSIACWFLVCVAATLVQSKSLHAKHKTEHASKVEKGPHKRISTQQKIGSGHAKGPMANNVQNSVPLPVVMPFPMIPFDDRYPIIFTPNGKPKKGKDRKKDPQGETEDETDKDVDDDSDDGEKQYKGPGKVAKGPYLKNGPEVMQNSEKGSPEDDREDDEEAAKEKEVSRVQDDEDENEDDEESERQKGKSSKSKAKSKAKSSKNKASRQRRSIYKPIIGNPEDIMPYLMWGYEEQEALDESDTHKIVSRAAEEEEPQGDDSQDQYDEALAMQRRDVAEQEEEDEEQEEDPEEIDHVINTRDVSEEEDEDEARDMKPRSLPDGRSYETVQYHRKFEESYKAPQNFLQ